MKTEPNKFFVSTTDGAGVAAVSILDKKHCNWAIRGYFSVLIFLPKLLFSNFINYFGLFKLKIYYFFREL